MTLVLPSISTNDEKYAHMVSVRTYIVWRFKLLNELYTQLYCFSLTQNFLVKIDADRINYGNYAWRYKTLKLTQLSQLYESEV